MALVLKKTGTGSIVEKAMSIAPPLSLASSAIWRRHHADRIVANHNEEIVNRRPLIVGYPVMDR
jgi:hypothetical protein